MLGAKGDKTAHPQLPELANLPSPSYPHGCKHDGKVVIMIIQHGLGFLHQPSLPTDLGSNLAWSKLGGRTSEPTLLSTIEEDGQVSILSSCQSLQ